MPSRASASAVRVPSVRFLAHIPPHLHPRTCRLRISRRGAWDQRIGQSDRRELSADTSVISGFDKDARPIVYMRPRHENTETSPRQIRHLIYVL